MKTLGIFGDSFASPFHGHDADIGLEKEAWIYKLNRDVNVYAQGGSSVYYSYRKFLDNHEKHDTNIFVITNLTRIPFEITEFTEYNHWMLTCGNAARAKDHINLKHMTDSTKLKICQAIADWYDHLMPHFPFYDFGHLMYNEIKRLRPDTLFIPVHYMDDGKSCYNIQIPGVSMTDYMSLTVNSLLPEYVGDRNSWSKIANHFPEKRTICHYSIEVNDLVASDVIKALDTGVWRTEPLPDSIRHSQPFDYYFETLKKGHWYIDPRLD